MNPPLRPAPRLSCVVSVPTTIRDRIEQVLEKLPVPSSLAVQVAALDADRIDYFERVHELVDADPGFALRVLHMANSAQYRAGRPVLSTAAALLRVGARAAAGLMLADSIQRVFPALDRGARELWMHSVLAACFMRRMAPMVSNTRIDPGEAYTAGLLHDIGRFLMLAHNPQQFQMVEQARWDGPEELARIEVGWFGYTHADLGYLALHQWHLPEAFAVVARDHHRGVPAVAGEGKVESLLALLADVDGLATLVAREGLGWFDDAMCSAAWLEQNTRLRYRWDLTHRVSVLRSATREAHELLEALGLSAPEFVHRTAGERSPPAVCV